MTLKFMYRKKKKKIKIKKNKIKIEKGRLMFLIVTNKMVKRVIL